MGPDPVQSAKEIIDLIPHDVHPSSIARHPPQLHAEATVDSCAEN